MTGAGEVSLAAPAADAPAAEVARDMARRGLMVMPVAMAVVAVVGGWEAAVSVAYAIAIVLVNFLLSAYLLRWAARISLGLVASVALGGYVMRLAMIFMAVWIVRDAPWVRMIPLGLAIIATHLGLLAWELRHVSASLAHPGLKPSSRSSISRGSRSLRRGTGRPAAGYRPEVDRTRSRGGGSGRDRDGNVKGEPGVGSQNPDHSVRAHPTGSSVGQTRTDDS